MDVSQVQGSLPAANSLCHAMDREHLASACIKALERKGHPGSGLKLLRLVSKHMCQAMQRFIQGYTLIIDGLEAERPDMSSLLQIVQLTRLLVEVRPNNQASHLTLHHARQVQEFVKDAGPALQTITTMDINAWGSYNGELMSQADVATVLSPLVQACPLVKRLKVSGNVGGDLLGEIGDCCDDLTRLETDNVLLDTLEELSELLPQVTSTRMKLFFDDHHTDHDHGTLEEYADAISSCLTLTSLDTGERSLTESLWRALPSCLRELHIGNVKGPADAERFLPAGLQLPSLRRIYFGYNDMSLAQLASLLRAAPKLQQLGVRDVLVPCTADQIPDLIFVHDRLSAGLMVNEGYREEHGEGLVLRLTGLSDPDPESPSQKFVASLPVFEHFTSVGVESVERPLLAQLARVFPRLRMLSIGATVQSSSFPGLKIFSSLQHLEFISKRKNRFSSGELIALCMNIPTLLFLDVDVYDADSKSVMADLRTWGRKVDVVWIPTPDPWPWPQLVA